MNLATYLFWFGAVGALFSGQIMLAIILFAIGFALSYSYFKSKKRLKDVGLSKSDIDKEKQRREQIMKEEEDSRKQSNESNNKEAEKLEYEKWVKQVKANKIYKDKEYISIPNVGLLWYEKSHYYLYLVNTDKKMYNLGYADGVIESTDIELYEDKITESVHHNNKLKGAIVGGALLGTTGAIIGQNVEDKPDEIKTVDINHYLVIDGNTFSVELSDYAFLKTYKRNIENKKK